MDDPLHSVSREIPATLADYLTRWAIFKEQSGQLGQT
jgi:hypothetical protein